MAGGDVVGFKCRKTVEEGAVLDVLVAAHARVRGAAGSVFGDESIDDLLLELLFEVHDVVANAELARNPAGIVDVFDAAALLVAAEFFRALFGPKAHGDADDFVALFVQEGGRDGAINAAGHADDDAGAAGCVCYHYFGLVGSRGRGERVWNPSHSPNGPSMSFPTTRRWI